MPKCSIRRSRALLAQDILFLLLCTFFVQLVLFRLWSFNPRIPITYDGDGLLMLDAFRNLEFKKWYFRSDLLGFPYGQQLQDFPAIADGFCLSLSWLLVKSLRDPILAFNVFYLLTYPLSALGGFIGARILELKRLTTIVIGILYTFLPFHTLHGAGHTYLVMYPIIPIVIAIVVKELKNVNFGEEERESSASHLKLSALVLTGIAAGASGLYFAFFSVILFGIGFFLILLTKQNFKRAYRLVIAIIATAFTVLIQAIPILLFQRSHGPNLSVASRTSAEVEYYSLRLIDLFRPISNHVLEPFRRFSEAGLSAIAPGEPTVHLGVFGSLGVVILLIGLLAGSAIERESDYLPILSKILLCCLLFSFLGGVNQILATLGFTQIRVWSRMSIVIGFLGLIALGILLEKLRLISASKRWQQILVVICIIVLGVSDTNRITSASTYSELSNRWWNDSNLVREIEDKFGRGARVFQYPVLKFPEQGSVNQLPDYAQLRGYLHSDSLCWSYGAVIGRDNNRTNDWKALELNELIRLARNQGFDVLWVERRAYLDNAVEIERKFTELLGPSIIEDKSKQVVIFDLRNSRSTFRESCHQD